MVRVKICGITNADDALLAAECGADALGFVFWKESPRYVEPGEAGRIIGKLPPLITPVGVFVDESLERVNEIACGARLGAIQLHGSETPEYCSRVNAAVVKTFRIKEGMDINPMGGYRVSAYLLDTFRAGTPGGTGITFNWDIALEAKKFGRIILSGGLNPENVKEAVLRVNPYAVDVSSGVELRPGKKDPDKISGFIKNAKGDLYSHEKTSG